MKQDFKTKLIYSFGIFWTVAGFGISTLLFREWKNYQELVADLMEIQATYNSYLLLAKAAAGMDNQLVTDEQRFVAVDRSEGNLKGLLPDLKPARRRPSRTPAVSVAKRTIGRRTAIFAWPLLKDHFWISSFFGPRKLGRTVRMHTGIDLAAIKGTPVLAAGSGKVLIATYEFGYGNTIVIEHSQKFKTRYAHLDEIFVRPGQVVNCGQKIGAVGDTGFVQAEGNSASHLHFEVYVSNKRVNPIMYLPRL